MSVNIQIDGIANVQKFLSSKGKEALKLADDAIKKAGFLIEGEVKDSISGHKSEPKSVDTGFFLRSILAIFPKQLTANIGCNAYPVAYANSLEYSPNIKGGPRSHFRNTKTRNEKKVKEFIEAEIKKI